MLRQLCLWQRAAVFGAGFAIGPKDGKARQDSGLDGDQDTAHRVLPFFVLLSSLNGEPGKNL